MAISQNKHFKKKSGLTLIEVLIALAIISIAMTAVIKASSQNIRGTSYLEKKTIATWVATQLINEVRANSRSLKQDDEQGNTVMLGETWYWQLKQEETPNKRIKKIVAQIFLTENDRDKEQSSPLVTLLSYRYVE